MIYIDFLMKSLSILIFLTFVGCDEFSNESGLEGERPSSKPSTSFNKPSGQGQEPTVPHNPDEPTTIAQPQRGKDQEMRQKLATHRDLLTSELKTAEAGKDKFLWAKNLWSFFEYGSDDLNKKNLNENYIKEQKQHIAKLKEYVKDHKFPKTVREWTTLITADNVKRASDIFLPENPYVKIHEDFLGDWTPVGGDTAKFDYEKIISQTEKKIGQIEGILEFAKDNNLNAYHSIKSGLKKIVDDNEKFRKRYDELKSVIDEINLALGSSTPISSIDYNQWLKIK